MKKVILGLFVFGLTLQFGLTSQLNAQVINDGMLPEVEVHYMNYKYLNSIGNAEAPINVKQLEREVANFDVKGSEYYLDEYDFYSVNFYIPDVHIVAAYDRLNAAEAADKAMLVDNAEEMLLEKLSGITKFLFLRNKKSHKC